MKIKRKPEGQVRHDLIGPGANSRHKTYVLYIITHSAVWKWNIS